MNPNPNLHAAVGSLARLYRRAVLPGLLLPGLLVLSSLALQGVAQAQAQAGKASTAQATELLNDKDAWELDGTAKFMPDGKLQLTAADEKPEEPQAVRRIQLPAASAWEAELRFSPQANAAAAGLLLLSADERWISVMLKPAQRGIQVSHGNSLTDDVVGLLNGDKLTAWADSGDQVLKVRGDGGKLQVWLNGQDLGFGSPYDFEPQDLAVRSEGGAAQFSSLSWRAAGQDGRLARLSGTVAIPGRPALFDEKFNSAAKEIVSGLFGSVLGRITGNKQEESSADDWPKNWSDEQSSFTRDTSGKRLRLEGKKAGEESRYASPASTYPLRNATVALTARVKLSVLPGPGAAGGIYLEDRWRSGKPDDTQGNIIYVNLFKGQLRLEQFNASSGKWTLLQGYLWPHKDKEVELRLVTRGWDAWVFVDRHLVMSQRLEGLSLSGISGGGLRIEGSGVVEASSFRIDEL